MAFKALCGGMATMAQCYGAGPGRTEGNSLLWILCLFRISLWWCPPALVCTGPSNYVSSTCLLAAHLLQLMVDARASQHVEDFAFNLLYRRVNERACLERRAGLQIV